jgi:hypothetical protein
MRRTFVATVFAVALPAMLLVGCGGTDGSGVAGSDGTDDAVLDPDANLGDDTESDVLLGEDGLTEEGATGGTSEEPDDATDHDEAAGDDAGGTHLAAPEALEPRVQEAIADLLDGGVDRDAIELVVAEPVVWADGSIGCPEPGMMYTQALVEGYRIVFEVDGAEIAYHGAGNQPPFRCDDPAEPAGGGNPTS